MKSLFEPVAVGPLSLRNRIIRSATFENTGGAEGRFSPDVSRIYEDLAAGGVGAIISGMVGVDENSRLSPDMVKAYDSRFVADLAQLAGVVHKHGSRLMVQLSHCGIKATQLAAEDTALGPIMLFTESPHTVRGMEADDIQAVTEAFAKAALACKEAGADGVQIHAAHGYLLSQFLSPFYNKRVDEYGGDMGGRGRIVLEVYNAIRNAVGPEYSVWIKINGSDLVEDGLTVEECLQLCAELAKRGIDAIEVSGGIALNGRSIPSRRVKDEAGEGYFSRDALFLAENLAVPVISVGGFRTPAMAEQILNKGNLAALSLSRPLISEPGLVNRWLSGDRSKARCLSCNKCFRPRGSFGCQAFEA